MKESFPKVKSALLVHVQSMFEEMEQTAALRHQESFALLEDAFENATDVDELRVAFEQWHSDHSEDLELEQDVDEMWDAAIGGLMDEEFGEDDDIAPIKRKTTASDDEDEFDGEDDDDEDDEIEDDYSDGPKDY